MATINDLWTAFVRCQQSSNAMHSNLTAIGDPEIDRQWNFYRLVLISEHEGCLENIYEDTVDEWHSIEDGIDALNRIATTNEEAAKHG